MQRGNLWQTAVDDAKHGRIGHIPLTWLLYIPYFFKSVFAARFFSVASIAFDMTALYCFIKNNAGRHAAFLSGILFISFACISNQHSLFVSYTIGHQIPSGLVLFALNEFTLYYSDLRKKKHLIYSSLLLTAASFLYEACTAFIILFFIYAFFRNKDNSSGRFRRSVYDCSVHAAMLVLYVLIYVLWRRMYPSDYSGSVFSFENIPRSIITLFRYSFGMIPGLPAAAMYLKKYITADELKNSLSLWILASPVVSSVSFYFLFPKISDSVRKTETFLFCAAGLFVPNIIICFTPKYTEWTAGNSYSYVTSFYSYYFLIILFTAVSAAVFRKKSRAAVTSMSLLVFCISLVSSVNNAAWNCFFERNLERYTAFSEAVSSDYFDRLEDGTVVYTPDYTGIHNDMSVTESFVSVYTDVKLSFTNDISPADFSRPVIIMKYDSVTGTVLCGRLHEDMTFETEFVTEKR